MNNPILYFTTGFCTGFIFSSSGLAGFSAGVLTGVFCLNEYLKHKKVGKEDIEENITEQPVEAEMITFRLFDGFKRYLNMKNEI